MKVAENYNFSFTAASLRVFNFIRLAEAVDYTSDELTIKDVDVEKVLSKGNKGSSKREMAELIKRFNALTNAQKQVLKSEGVQERKQLAFLGLCKSNAFIRDFVVEMVREKILVFDYTLSNADFSIFLNRKRELHPQLDQFADSTKKKAKQVLYKVLEEVGMIDTTKNLNIQPQWLNQEVLNVIINDDPMFLKFFLISDKDIELHRENHA